MKKTITLPSKTALLCAVLLLLAAVATARAANQEDIEILDRSAKAIAEVVKEVKPAVVHISVESTVQPPAEIQEFFNNPFFERFFGPQFRFQQPDRPQQRRQYGAGSGFIISEDGHILTNNHVIDKAEKMTVTLADNSKVEAKLIGSDPQSDVALIKIDVDRDLPTLPLGDSDALEVGEWVIAIGNPFGLNQTVTVGVVSAKGRSRVGINEYENFIQTDAAINPGNSGGPLLNIHGEVIGINSALYSRTGGYMGIGFAIPINMVKSIEDQLQKHGKVTRGWLGVVIQDVTEELAPSFGLKKAQGILVSEAQPDSPAAKAGLQQGDVILKLNDAELKDVADLRNRIALTIPGTTVTLQVLRDGKPSDIQVEVGEQPSDFGIAQDGGASGALGSFGLALQELTPDLAKQLGHEGRQGVLVSEVEPGSVAEQAGLRAGHLIEEINQVKITSIRELQQVIDKSPQSNRILLRVRFGNFSQYVVLSTE
ncbi:DegQ family serine endoprotease [Desulfofustis limnaeus]|uniref:Peptidase n=1 Tax=Desulfofustis limnaeus TaxID=2740163 RepID=A0ABM7WDQ6_9BACT|nr:DegQ family serine endoprotease [Desulfofustis limnaeus]BDD89108.1 peptidase [Desulfofustis limnaeus]